MGFENFEEVRIENGEWDFYFCFEGNYKKVL